MSRDLSRVVDEIYILGDLVEMWIGDDDDGPSPAALVSAHKANNCPMLSVPNAW